MYPEESDMAMTLPPSVVAFTAANVATLPDPEMTTLAPSNERPAAFSISSVK